MLSRIRYIQITRAPRSTALGPKSAGYYDRNRTTGSRCNVMFMMEQSNVELGPYQCNVELGAADGDLARACRYKTRIPRA